MFVFARACAYRSAQFHGHFIQRAELVREPNNISRSLGGAIGGIGLARRSVRSFGRCRARFGFVARRGWAFFLDKGRNRRQWSSTNGSQSTVIQLFRLHCCSGICLYVCLRGVQRQVANLIHEDGRWSRMGDAALGGQVKSVCISTDCVVRWLAALA